MDYKLRAKITKNLNIGMIGASLLVISEWLSHAEGLGNVPNGLTHSNWAKMPMSRFIFAIIFAAVAMPLVYIGLRDMLKVVRSMRRRKNPSDFRMLKLYELASAATMIGFLFVHVLYAVMPITYKLLYKTTLMGADITSTVESVFYYFAVPYWVYILISAGGMTISCGYFILQGRFRVNILAIVGLPGIMLLIQKVIELTKVPVLLDFSSGFLGLGILFMLTSCAIHVTKMKDKPLEVGEAE